MRAGAASGSSLRLHLQALATTRYPSSFFPPLTFPTLPTPPPHTPPGVGWLAGRKGRGGERTNDTNLTVRVVLPPLAALTGETLSATAWGRSSTCPRMTVELSFAETLVEKTGRVPAILLPTYLYLSSLLPASRPSRARGPAESDPYSCYISRLVSIYYVKGVQANEHIKDIESCFPPITYLYLPNPPSRPSPFRPPSFPT